MRVVMEMICSGAKNGIAGNLSTSLTSGLIRMAWVYILKCADGSYYTGMTRGEEPDQRLSEHQMKLSPGSYTASRLPAKLVYSEYLELVADAIFAERKIKGWSRAKKEALIRGNWDSIQVLSKRRGGRPAT
jgi:putative endonuclease